MFYMSAKRAKTRHKPTKFLALKEDLEEAIILSDQKNIRGK